jgi:hypothetical protein
VVFANPKLASIEPEWEFQMYIEKKTLAIVGLSVLALLLTLANFSPPSAKAEDVIKDRDYQLITTRASAGGESLYVMDNRTGQIGVFMYDPNSHRLMLRKATSVPAIFAGQ